MSVQEDPDSGRLTYLGTGIGSLAGARSYLRSKWNRGTLPTRPQPAASTVRQTLHSIDETLNCFDAYTFHASDLDLTGVSVR